MAFLVATLVARLVRIRRVAVHGESMLPALAPGDRLVVVPAWRLGPGDVVALRDPRAPRHVLIKRVVDVDRALGLVSVAGDNRAVSTDSRLFGPVPRRAVLGRAAYRYGPPGREGWVARRFPRG